VTYRIGWRRAGNCGLGYECGRCSMGDSHLLCRKLKLASCEHGDHGRSLRTGNSYAGWSCKLRIDHGAGNTNLSPRIRLGICWSAVCRDRHGGVHAATPTDANTNTWVAAGSQLTFSQQNKFQCWAVLNANFRSSNTVTFDAGRDDARHVHRGIHRLMPSELDTSSSQAGTSNASTAAITAASLTPVRRMN
jgi:hypothetical protein